MLRLCRWVLEVALSLFGLLAVLYLSYGYLGSLWSDRYVLATQIRSIFNNIGNVTGFILQILSYDRLADAANHEESWDYVVSFESYVQMYVIFTATSMAAAVVVHLVASRSVRSTLAYISIIRSWYFLIHGFVFALAFLVGDIVHNTIAITRLATLLNVTSYSVGPAHIPYRLAGVIALAVSINSLVQLCIWKFGCMSPRYPSNCCKACGYEINSLPHCPECGPEVKVNSLVCPPLRLALIVPTGAFLIAIPLLLSPLWLSWIA